MHCTCKSNHCAVVRAICHWRKKYIDLFLAIFRPAFLHRFLHRQAAERFAQLPIRTNTACHNQRSESRLQQGLFHFCRQYVHNRILKCAANIVTGLLGYGFRTVCLTHFFNGSQNSGFQSRKTHLQIVGMNHRAWENKGIGAARFGKFGKLCAARIRQSE